MTVATLPNSEAVLIAFLKGHSALTSLSNQCVGTVIQPGWSGYAIRVYRVAGSPLSWYGDSPRIQIDCWSAKDDASGLNAFTLAATVAAALFDFPGAHGGTWVSNVDIADGPAPEVDDQSRPRYRLDVQFDIYLAP